jgi:protein TonB
MARLASFLLASTALHAALLAGGTVIGRIDAGGRSESIAVRLEGGGNRARPLPAPVANNTAPTAPATEPAQDAAMQTVATAAAAVRVSDAPANTDPQPTSYSPGEASARVYAKVINELARHFYYPTMARRHGWEGRVLLGFHVGQDGRMRDPRVLHSSGYGVLDEAALNSLRKVERVVGQDSAPLDMQIPVVYRLTDAR